jgi:hypothetical protein
MERSFSLRIEKAREQMQGAGTAMLKWSLTEAKSQLEVVRLLCGAPRFFCSLEFEDLWLKSEIRQLKNKYQIAECQSKDLSLTSLGCRSLRVAV